MRTLLFDIDGTLLLTHGGGSGAMKLALQDEFGLDTASADIDFSGRTDLSLLPELLELNQLPTHQENQDRLLRRYTQLLPNVLQQHGGTVLPGVVELLRLLAQEPDVHCCVMTGNLQVTAMKKLEHFGLHSFFRKIFGGDHDRRRDDLALRTADAIRQSHGEQATEDVIVIGDTPADIRCGHTIGAKVVAVCTGNHARDELAAESPYSVQEDLSDVEAIRQLLVA